MSDPTTIRRLYGRRTGHKLRAGQTALTERLLPELSVPGEGPLDAPALFGDDRPLELEIGFGRGEHLAGRPRCAPIAASSAANPSSTASSDC
jgi:tRNA (guanine-N7-)-methyltransferase